MSAGLRRLLPPPHRRPGLLAVLVRWRAELLALGLVTGLWHYAGGFAVGAVGTLLVLLTAFVPPVRVVVRDAVQAVVAMHRVRAGMVQAGIADRRGRVPWIVGATARKDIVLVSLWLHAGTVPDDLRGATAVLATACGAAEAQIHHRSLRQDRVVVAVVRPRWGWPTR